ncbi:MAG: Uma2 family endonuclease, partial [Bacillota bacterium]
ISGRLEKMLREWVEEQHLGEVYDAPTDVVLSEHNVVQPDIFYISRERLGIIKVANIQGAPDMVVEILSPNSLEWDRVTKRHLYAKYGVREFWVVDPEGRTIEVTVLRGRELATLQVYPTGTTLVSPLLPGLQVPIDQVFGQ